jgi:UDP-glucose 4-epimerase
MKVLVTGGAGYIGGTAVSLLLDQGHAVHVLDDCSTGHADSIDPRATFFQDSLLNPTAVKAALSDCDAVLHFGAKSLVGESVVKPDIYWETNVSGTRILLDEMRKANIGKLVFSSTAATYGEPKEIPITERAETDPTNPYGASKLAVDYMISAQAKAYGLAAISLRYFNVAGALKTARGWLTERHDPETHLIPNVLRASVDNPLKMFGNDWPTKDGTCIRDYVHVVDLIEAHISALKVATPATHEIINLGSGGGYSVTEVIAAATRTLERTVPFEIAARRAGDPAVLIADITKAGELLAWKPQRNLDQMVSDAWKSFQ